MAPLLLLVAIAAIAWGISQARSLKEAILMHGSEGSEAKAVIDNFKKLSKDDQELLIDFLLSLRLPIQKGLEITNSLPISQNTTN